MEITKKKCELMSFYLRPEQWLWQMGIVFEGEKRKKEGLKSKVV